MVGLGWVGLGQEIRICFGLGYVLFNGLGWKLGCVSFNYLQDTATTTDRGELPRPFRCSAR